MKYVNMILGILMIFYLVMTLMIVNHVFLGDALFYPANSRWTLVWRDEFNGSALDTSKWTAVNQGSSLFDELQAYLDENAAILNGRLNMLCKEEQWTGPDNFRPGQAVTRHYTSAFIMTKHKKDWTFGRFEIRAKMPKGKGLTPYIGLIAADNHWPPEIGIGMPGGHPTRLFLINHWMQDEKHGQEMVMPKFAQDFSEGFHTFTIEWEPRVIRWAVDGIVKFQTRKEVPNEPLYLLIRNSVGGDFSVDPRDNGNRWEEPAVFPQNFEVDWVRVFQKT